MAKIADRRTHGFMHESAICPSAISSFACYLSWSTSPPLAPSLLKMTNSLRNRKNQPFVLWYALFTVMRTMPTHGKRDDYWLQTCSDNDPGLQRLSKSLPIVLLLRTQNENKLTSETLPFFHRKTCDTNPDTHLFTPTVCTSCDYCSPFDYSHILTGLIDWSTLTTYLLAARTRLIESHFDLAICFDDIFTLAPLMILSVVHLWND